MKIKINNVINDKSNYTVFFSTEYGNAIATWSSVIPEINKEYFVELEIPKILNWQKDIFPSEIQKNIIGMEDNMFFFIGFLESVDEDGYTIIRLDDNIISLEIEGNPLQLGTCVKVKVDNLFLYDMNY